MRRGETGGAGRPGTSKSGADCSQSATETTAVAATELAAETARRDLLTRLRTQDPENAERWTRDELYDKEPLKPGW
jgi:hypothetical protein